MVRHASPPIPVGTSSTPIYAITANRRARLKKILAYNPLPSDATITLQTADGTAVSPPLVVKAGSNLIIGEDQAPEIDFYGAINAVASASGVILQVEVEEY